MKGLILAGGTGSRLRPLTYTSAKQLIPVANKPILFYAIEAIKEAGIREIGIIVGETGDEVRALVGTGSRWGVEITYLQQDAPLGLAHAVMVAEAFIREEPFMMFLGDNLIKEGVTRFVEQFLLSKPNALILLSEVEEPQRFGVAELKDGKIIKLVEKPKVPPSNLALVGVYLFDKNIFTAVKQISPSWRNELEITDAIQYLVEKGYTVEPHLIQGWWKDTGKPEDVLECNRLLLENIQTKLLGFVDYNSVINGRVILEAGAQIINSVIRGPVIIGQDSIIADSYVGPFTSVGENVTINNSEVEFSIILAESKINNIGSRIDQSLIGRNVRVGQRQEKPQGLRLILGDNSQLDL